MLTELQLSGPPALVSRFSNSLVGKKCSPVLFPPFTQVWPSTTVCQKNLAARR